MTATCDCVESCAMADQFTPATRELMVFTKSAKRYFDLDAVREPYTAGTLQRGSGTRPNGGKATSAGRGGGFATLGPTDYRNADPATAGAPPLDWWKIDPDIPYTPQHEGEQMPATFYVGDAIEVMGKLPENSVDLILTSPPFLALRSYLPSDHPDKGKEGGSQSTPGEFIDWLLDVVEACDRVLAPHGSLVFELGDTYAGSGGAGGDYYAGGWREGERPFDGSSKHARIHDPSIGPPIQNKDGKHQPGGSGWPLAKSLSLIPESFRFAMVYGVNPHTGRTTEPWRLRNVIRWVRPNPPVGALGDKFRPATSELMVFCKSAKRYFDLDAVREAYADPTRYGKDQGYRKEPDYAGTDVKSAWTNRPGFVLQDRGGAPPLDWWNIPLLEGEEPKKMAPKGGYDPEERRQRAVQQTTNHGGSKEARQDFGESFYNAGNPLGAPPLDWWNIPPGGFSGAHYAVFPPELCVKPVKAMCPEKVCRQCGEPSRRITDVSYEAHGIAAIHNAEPKARADYALQQRSENAQGMAHGRATKNVETLGFSDCGHNDWRPGMVLDPFAGSGTTLAVATGHGRDAIGVDLDSRNFDLALERVGPFILTRGT